MCRCDGGGWGRRERWPFVAMLIATTATANASQANTAASPLQDRDGRTALEIAVRGARTAARESMAIVEALLASPHPVDVDKGYEPPLVGVAGSTGRSMCWRCCWSGVARPPLSMAGRRRCIGRRLWGRATAGVAINT